VKPNEHGGLEGLASLVATASARLLQYVLISIPQRPSAVYRVLTYYKGLSHQIFN